MKSTKLCVSIASVALAFAFTTSASADDKWLGDVGSNWLEHAQTATSSKTRAEVRAELEQARRDGQLFAGEEPFYPRQTAPAQRKTRAEVQAEVIQSAKASKNSPDSTYFGG